MDKNLCRWRYIWWCFNGLFFRWENRSIYQTSGCHFIGGEESLQVELNVLGKGCGGCPYCDFPYKAQIPISIDGKREIREFKSKKDVWNVIELLIKEVLDVNAEGNNFDIAKSISAQIPFFACPSSIYDRSIQKDIQRYIYCKELNVPPYEGCYGSQPFLWVERFFIIKSALAKYEKGIIDAAKHSDNKI